MPAPTTAPDRRRTWLLRALVVIMLALLLGWLSRASWLPLLLGFLDVSKPPHAADFIVILGAGENRTRAGIDLYQQGVAPRIIICGFYRDKLQGQIDMLWEAGIPESAVIINIGGENTWEEAVRVMALLQENAVQSALIITDAYHTRRAQATYTHLQQDPVIELTFVAAADRMTPDNWWQVGWKRATVFKEYVGLGYYLVRYGAWPFS